MTLPLVLERTGQGTPVVLLHGFTGRGRSMAGVATALADRHESIAPDLPGHGASLRRGDGAAYQFDRCVDDLLATLEQAGHARAHWLGYSMGARLALGCAVRHPQCVRSLVLLGARAGMADPAERAARREADERLAARIEAAGIAPFVDEWLAQPLFRTLLQRDAAAPARERAARLGNDPHELAAALRGCGPAAQPPLHAWLEQVAVPVLLVAGALDERFVAHAQDLARRLPRAELHTIPDAGHAAHVEQPEAFAAVVRDFLRRAEAAAPTPFTTQAEETRS
ncbi:MAG TPA: 2-succinyl-6-hydroxy-2,4-cyclohexadiene-1-carboxylate synthase [Steroidobacteraceae bacterium]|nr:2-succinyl-6-hydroxy-2,4-cyclohexadiene-1-carboxylate synthase [Steroidobacteraceae bacterium]